MKSTYKKPFYTWLVWAILLLDISIFEWRDSFGSYLFLLLTTSVIVYPIAYIGWDTYDKSVLKKQEDSKHCQWLIKHWKDEEYNTAAFAKENQTQYYKWLVRKQYEAAENCQCEYCKQVLKKK